MDTNTSRANKRKGSQWETDLVEYFRDKELLTERLRLTGANDEGDLWFIVDKKTFVVEAKNEKSFKPGPWVKEAVLEAVNFAKKRKTKPAVPIVVAKRRQHSTGKAFVIMELDTLMELVNE